MDSDRSLLRDFRLKRLQRAAEYALLATMHVFFLLAFHNYYRWWMALLLAAATFGMNFQLTQLREQRRIADGNSRQRVMSDTFESILFLVFIVLLSSGGLVAQAIDVENEEYLGYVAAILGGLFLAGLCGEMYWQFRNFALLEPEKRRNYIRNLRRTIILPFTVQRHR